jgi:hypothetical protein
MLTYMRICFIINPYIVVYSYMTSAAYYDMMEIQNETVIQQLIEKEVKDNNNRSRKASKVIARDVVRIRGATGEENPPIIISVPRKILNAASLRKGDEVRIYTDGARIYLEKLGEPEI